MVEHPKIETDKELREAYIKALISRIGMMLDDFISLLLRIVF